MLYAFVCILSCMYVWNEDDNYKHHHSVSKGLPRQDRLLLCHRHRHRCCFPWTVRGRGHDRDRGRRGREVFRGHLECVGRVCIHTPLLAVDPILHRWLVPAATSCPCDTAAAGPIEWSFHTTRYPDLVTADREGAVWEHRRLLSGYGTVQRAVVSALRRESGSHEVSEYPNLSLVMGIVVRIAIPVAATVVQCEEATRTWSSRRR